jgi:hypothetical protein
MHNPQRSASLPTVRTVPRTVAKASSTPQHASTVVLLECLSKITELTPLPKQPPRGEYHTDKSYYGDRGTYCNLTISNNLSQILTIRANEPTEGRGAQPPAGRSIHNLFYYESIA